MNPLLREALFWLGALGVAVLLVVLVVWAYAEPVP